MNTSLCANKDNYVLGNSVVPGLAQIQLANAMVSWETTYVTNIGLDFSLFGSKAGWNNRTF